jgi:sulfopyruvate decarboxylase subunit alpha
MSTSAVARVLQTLVDKDRNFVTSVPDKGLDALIRAVDSDRRFIHVACTREEEAVGLCAGAAFAGRRGVLLMQNSGLGNAVNALTSLVSLYELPLLLLISMRGGPGERIAAQRPMGRATRGVLEACGVSIVDCSGPDDVLAALAERTEDRLAILASPEGWAALAR